MAPKAPTTGYKRDAYSIGEVAQQWRRDPTFIKQLIAGGELEIDDLGLIPRRAIRDYVQTHGSQQPAS